MTDDDLLLVIDGQQISGWTGARFARSCEQFPSSFELQVTEKDPTGTKSIFTPFQKCDVYLGADKVSTGYIDGVSNGLDPTQHTMSIMGRSKCSDLVDCSAEFPGFPVQLQTNNTNLVSIARQLCEPYGINVTLQTTQTLATIPQYRVNIGDTPYEIIERIARFQNLLVYDDTHGDLVLSDLHYAEHASGFKVGENVQAINLETRFDHRFSEIDVFDQTVNSQIATSINLPYGRAFDNTIRHRRLMLYSEAPFTPQQDWAPRRAGWEMARRIGRSQIIRLQTDSWRDKAGRLWTPNNYVTIDAPTMRINHAKWIIADVVFSKTQHSGTVADLSLMPPEAFVIEPTVLLPMDAALSVGVNQK